MNVADRVPGLDHSVTTSTYATWHFDEVELRSFLLTSVEGMKAWFQSKELEAEKAVELLDPEETYGDEAFNHFMVGVGIFSEPYWNHLAAAVIKDAFTLFEVFLEESADRLLHGYRSGLKNLSSENTWLIRDCNRFYEDYLGFPILTADVEDIQWIRNKLSHLRDSLRTEQGQKEFSERLKRLGVGKDETEEEQVLRLPHHEFGRKLAFSKPLVLSPLEAWRIVGILRAHVEQLTVVLHSIQYGGQTTEALEALREGSPVRTGSKGDVRFLHIPEVETIDMIPQQ